MWFGVQADGATGENGFHLGIVSIAFDRDWFNSLKDLHPSLAHAIDYVLAQVFVDMVKAGRAHQGFARCDGRSAGQNAKGPGYKSAG